MFSLMFAAIATVAQAASPTSGQALFDQATKAWSEGRCTEAVPAFDTLAASAAAKRSKTLAAAIDVRRGLCLAKLGRPDEAEASLRRGVESMQAGDAFKDETREAYQQLAGLALLRLDYDSGIAAANRALALAEGGQRIRPLLLLGALTRFDGDGTAVRVTGEALQLVEASPAVKKEEIGAVQVAAARALLAVDRVDEGNALLKKALANNGGLTTRTSLSDVATRYDLAQAALLKKRMDDARLYLAYTGAGRQTESPFARAESLELPHCDDVPGLTPESMAVIEFSLSDTGVVTRAEPIYARGGREVALAFARAVRSWSWTPEAAKAIPPFYRQITRVELRCTRGADVDNFYLPIAAATAAWLEEQGVTAPPDNARDGDLIAGWRTAAAGQDAAALNANLSLARSPLSLPAEKTLAATRAVALSKSLGAPQAVRTRALMLESDGFINARDPATYTRQIERRAAAHQALLADREVAADPLSAATLRLAIAQSSGGDRKRGGVDASALLAAVSDAPDLPERHPLKMHALLAQANAAAASGDLAAAAAAFARTGLTEQQCALIGPRPSVASSGASSSLYPTELIQMGFEGWTQIEFDIAADGKTAAQRTLIAYPPFLFGDAAKTMIAKTRYARSYRPEASVACAANRQSFMFRIPR